MQNSQSPTDPPIAAGVLDSAAPPPRDSLEDYAEGQALPKKRQSSDSSRATKKSKKKEAIERLKAERGLQSWGHWSPEECAAFDLAMYLYGDDWKKIQEMVGTRTRAQVMSHSQKQYDKQKREQVKKWKEEEAKQAVAQPPPLRVLPGKRVLTTKLFNVIRHYRSPALHHIKKQYELDYEVIIVPKNEIDERSLKKDPAPPAPPPPEVPPPPPVPPIYEPSPTEDIAPRQEEDPIGQRPLEILRDLESPPAEEGSQAPPGGDEVIGERWRTQFTSIFAIPP